MLIGHIAPVSSSEVMNQVIKVGNDDRQDLRSVSLDQRVLLQSASPMSHTPVPLTFAENVTNLGIKV